MTDSKTAREWAKQTELIIECYDGLDGGRASREETRKVLEKAFTDYASDKDKRIAQLEAEVERVRSSHMSVESELVCLKSELDFEKQELTSLKSSLAEKEAEIATLKQIKQSLERSLGDAI